MCADLGKLKYLLGTVGMGGSAGIGGALGIGENELLGVADDGEGRSLDKGDGACLCDGFGWGSDAGEINMGGLAGSFGFSTGRGGGDDFLNFEAGGRSGL